MAMGMWWGVPSLPSIAMHEGMLGIDRNESPLEKKTKKTNFNEKMTKNSGFFGKITGKCLTMVPKYHILVL